jgi:hypothetical protein
LLEGLALGDDRSVGRRCTAKPWRSRERKAGQNQVTARQQMRWTPKGAHLLLQLRTRVLNEELDAVFQR